METRIPKAKGVEAKRTSEVEEMPPWGFLLPARPLFRSTPIFPPPSRVRCNLLLLEVGIKLATRHRVSYQ